MAQTRNIVVPALPPIDKFIAAKRVILDHPNTHFNVMFCDVNIPTVEHYKLWDGGVEGSAILIDIADEKYHGRCLSASQMQKMKSSTTQGATWNKLQEMANRNNQDGFLKKNPLSAAKLIREIPHVFSDRPRGESETWTYGMTVVNSYFWPQNQRSWESLFTDPDHKALLRMWEGFEVVGEPADFTLPFYFRRMFCAGRTVETIFKLMSWWLDHLKQVATRHEQARKNFYGPKQFSWGNGARAGSIQIQDYFQGSAFTYQWIGSGKLALGILRNPNGGVVIQTSMRHNVDLEALYHELARLEPARWYFEERFAAGPMLMNQSWQFIGVSPTSYSDDDLRQLVVKHVQYNGRKQRQA